MNLSKLLKSLRAWWNAGAKPKPAPMPPPVATPETPSNGGPLGEPDGAHPPPSPEPEYSPVPAVDDFAGVTKYNGKSRGDWPVTVQISNVRVTGDTIRWDEPKGQREARGWNVVGAGKRANGEVNLIVPSVGAAGCFDFLGVGQTVKTVGNLLYKNASEPGMFAPWQPKRGDRVGFYICTLNRVASQHKLSERSNVVWFTWP